ncbi:DUF3455 domain-containing protein [Collimonas silvisoli]|uniref:DUF3455 domain-containing protein n=1 Tax=Collimonas silvisoli TaxID=2825884 RepID=UPI001B8B0C87|nr:DUF3455 domain-containing protein [Collimonas silvisoli]
MARKMLGLAVATWCAPLLVACAGAPGATPITIPDNLNVAPPQTLSLEVQASGVQIYQCAVAKADASQFEWRFVAPQADLFDRDGKKIGRHYAGPTWESIDGSKVVGAVQAQNAGPDAGAIPWLLLSAKSTSGTGVFGLTQSIQRLQTVGGKAPAAGCDQAQLGKEARVPYQAIYRFYSARS